jgi:hypothetical protein
LRFSGARGHYQSRSEPTLLEQWREKRQPSPGFVIIALAVIAVIPVIGGGVSVAGGISDHSSESGADILGGIAAFLAGWFFAGFAYACRKPQLGWQISAGHAEERKQLASAA